MSTNPVDIQVQTLYLGDQSRPDRGQYAFSYTITISNLGTEPVTLISRHWVIMDADQKRQDVHGDGVIGQQPTIAPGHDFTYTSGVVLDTPVGTMQGAYQMKREDGSMFDAPIAPFLLAIPGAIN
ncbi:MAG: magnesium transporter ApaG [Gammaproteobacteria bacterium BRH_c0]|nr:MAG: magnesium transporter ApaG [Gammaproteobacteria bacterium BRH_c0]